MARRRYVANRWFSFIRYAVRLLSRDDAVRVFLRF